MVIKQWLKRLAVVARAWRRLKIMTIEITRIWKSRRDMRKSRFGRV